MNKVYFSSDFHGYHRNICRGVSQWDKVPVEGPISGIHGIQSTRDFNSVEEMNDSLIKGINSTVDHDDILYFLGDFTFQGIDKIKLFRDRIACRTIHFLYGNHDHHIEMNHVLDGVPLQSLFSSTQQVLHTTINGQLFTLSHYAHRVWPKSHHGAIHLYGHSHDSLDRNQPPWGRSMDVGIDSAFRMFGEYRPFVLEEILKIMNKRQVKFIDHHIKGVN